MIHPEPRGAVFDLDGVLTATAKVHAQAWEQMFNDFLQDYAAENNTPFLPFDRFDDYAKHVDGKPRYAGVKAFLESRGIKLPYGETTDSPKTRTICGLGNRKNDLFQSLLREQGPEVFASSIAFVEALRAAGIGVAVASSSKNASLVLDLAGLKKLFDAVVDGSVSEELGLSGKPEPDIFVEAARRIGADAGECIVVEDAISGVQAGQKGNFGLVVGVARNTDAELLRRFGADIVVQDLGELDLTQVQRWFAEGMGEDAWHIAWHGFDPGDEKLRETLTATGNGHFATRGAFEGERASFNFYPGTYVAGLYDKAESDVHGRTVANNDLVNCPNWLPLEIGIGHSGFQSPLAMEILTYCHSLDMRAGLHRRILICRDGLGRLTRIEITRLTSMADPHLCGLRYALTPLNWSEILTVRAGLDGNVQNEGVARYKELAGRHLELVQAAPAQDGLLLRVRTRASGHEVCMRARTRATVGQEEVALARHVTRDGAAISETFKIFLEESATCVIEKIVAVHASLHHEPGSDLAALAETSLSRAPTFERLLSPHLRAWKKLWHTADLCVTHDRFAQKILRLHIYHLLSAASAHNTRLDAGAPARGLHGEAYRGHIFWDELFIMPFYELNFPRVARALLLYRVRRLDAARALASSLGLFGACYPWQSADDGSEETQEVHYNPESGEWGPDLSRNQRHVSIAVFYNLWRHAAVGGDHAFVRREGAEVMLEIARFWASLAKKEGDGRYHIRGVMGPDEFHEKLPDAEEPGLPDNAYTNVMVAWLMRRALELWRSLSAGLRRQVGGRVGLSPEELDVWREMTTRMYVPFAEYGVLSQFEGYTALPELDWERYRKRYYSIGRMDRILKAEGDSPDNYKVAKQADVLMLWYALPAEEVHALLWNLGYHVPDATDLLRRNYAYYVRRTSHGSTLSKVVHAVVAAEVEEGDESWRWFREALASDVFDTQGGTTQEGIHSGVMAGTLQIVMRHFAGLDLSGEHPCLSPRLPSNWHGLAFRFTHRGLWFYLELTHERALVRLESKGRRQAVVACNDEQHAVAPGEPLVLDL
ncbi:beta-phosphoglucomutase family hydrolase [Desulfovibrio sp. X2]|uniref:beta-phosphoglucomutase family hydrolase n=1 Tax=Desulfovibrio sp. X2 TaxID=941449 RepID=UPI000358E23D|nr:beta-phosphoglucomutase family hydrolase [Desulfovibrio sp. X2]EPR43877.1 beta-phosphoglucomutase family hydrolase [Desulfovibrio sp. X2]